MIIQYYLFKEIIPCEFPAESKYHFKYLNFNEIRNIENIAKGFGFWHIVDRLLKGHRCHTLRNESDIITFAFICFRQANYLGTNLTLKPNEAYIYFSYTFPAYRGNNYARELRYKIYQHYKALGIDTYYSFVNANNKAGLKFKEGLNAIKLKKLVYIKFLFIKFVVILKDYKNK